MSADLLMRAAFELRKHAVAATPGPWSAVAQSTDGQDFVLSRAPQDGEKEGGNFKAVTIDVLSHDGNYSVDLARQAVDAAYIALMSPPVAMALARLIEEGLPYASIHRPESFPIYNAALEAARAVLREPEEKPDA